MDPNNFQSESLEQNEISLAEIFFHYLRYWKFFLLSIFICLGLAYAYLRYTTPEYKVSSTIIISDDKKGQTVDMATAFSDLGIVTAKNNLDNEIEILRSYSLTKGVVDSLKICINYYKKRGIKVEEIYKSTPVFATIENIIKPGWFVVDSDGENMVSIYSGEEDFNQKVNIGEEIVSPWGVIKITKNPFGTETLPIEVSVDPNYIPDVNINAVSKTASVVELSFVTPTPQKGEDIINTLINLYNSSAINDKNLAAQNAIDFIELRLLEVSGELKNAEKNVEEYLKSEGITDLQAQGHLLLSSSQEFYKQKNETNMQLNILRDLKSFISNPDNKNSTVSANVGVTDPTVIFLINTYNTEILARQSETVIISEKHPIYITLSNKIAKVRDDLLGGISLVESGLQTRIRDFEKQENLQLAKAVGLSTQERESRGLLRQQSLKETTNNYLLQKREETLLSFAMATPNAKMIDPARYSKIPVKPKKMIILLAALMIGCILPVSVIYVKDLFDNKIHSKEDVTNVVKAPFLGYIPVIKNDDPFPVLKIRSSMAERFRSVISNLEFIVGSERRKVIAVTSFTSGDGKSFFSRNLAMTLATMGKKTLLVDLDLRKSVLVETLGMTESEKGSAMFLSDPNIQISDIVDKTHKFHKNLDIIPVRVFPPNPAELLSSERLEQLFQAIGRDYEYVIVDTAPIGLVADAYNINPYSLATIFLLRSDYTLKKALPEVQEYYKDKKLNNLCVVLNAMSEENIYGYGAYGFGKYGRDKYYTDEG